MFNGNFLRTWLPEADAAAPVKSRQLCASTFRRAPSSLPISWFFEVPTLPTHCKMWLEQFLESFPIVESNKWLNKEKKDKLRHLHFVNFKSYNGLIPWCYCNFTAFGNIKNCWNTHFRRLRAPRIAEFPFYRLLDVSQPLSNIFRILDPENSIFDPFEPYKIMIKLTIPSMCSPGAFPLNFLLLDGVLSRPYDGHWPGRTSGGHRCHSISSGFP